MAKAKVIGEIVEAMIEKMLRPGGKKGSYLIPGTDQVVRGKAAAVKAFVEAANDKDASPRTRTLMERALMAQRVSDLAESGMSQADISDEVSADSTVVGDLIRWAAESPIIWSDEDELAVKVVAARDDDQLAWAGIAIKAGVTKSLVQKLYRQVGKNPDKSDIGKGGRRKATYHSGVKAKPVAKKAAPKKATGKKAAPKRVVKKVAKKRTVKKAAPKRVVRKTTAKAKGDGQPF